jgi:hypothetical protein
MGSMNELKNRGVKDSLLAAVDGLTGFPDAIYFPVPPVTCVNKAHFVLLFPCIAPEFVCFKAIIFRFWLC